jgi:hypothetical protein
MFSHAPTVSHSARSPPHLISFLRDVLALVSLCFFRALCALSYLIFFVFCPLFVALAMTVGQTSCGNK